ncbi:hypothetical protein [Candidatus Nitrososphaera sp. FF02]|uniref:hypothetical protein n=1 Tax=Candidatus Nitrososphaera sp. FF02 TaxID=3398226 RepID=UPI0039E8FD94
MSKAALAVSFAALAIAVAALAISLNPADMHTSSHIRVDIIFSTVRDDGSVIGEDALYEIQRELAEEFGGVTRYPPFSGSSVEADGTIHDGVNNAGFFVVAQNTPENMEKFEAYKETLEARLDKSVFMTISPSAIA